MTQAQAPASPNATRSTGLFQNRIIRILLAVIALIIVLSVVAWAAFQQMRASRSTPLAHEPFPGATLINNVQSEGDSFRTRTEVYTTPGSFEKVMEYYTLKYGTLSVLANDGTPNDQGSDQGCQIYQNEGGGALGRCLIDNSQDDQVQRLLITVNVDSVRNLTAIEIVRDWAK
jgi:hypothetical protein